ncbi:Uncharacterised protein [uncultured archaeon]|nr:Uncharacterised protein [uncultured archaeon]
MIFPSSFFIGLAASSSMTIVCTPSSFFPMGILPPVATSAVRWKPDVFEPSMTNFLMVKISSAILASHIKAISSTVSSASLSIGWGGSSSSSMSEIVSS